MLTNAMPLSLFVTQMLIARTLWVHTVVRAKPDSWVMEKLVEVKRHINSYKLQCNARTLAVKRERRGAQYMLFLASRSPSPYNVYLLKQMVIYYGPKALIILKCHVWNLIEPNWRLKITFIHVCGKLNSSLPPPSSFIWVWRFHAIELNFNNILSKKMK